MKHRMQHLKQWHSKQHHAGMAIYPLGIPLGNDNNNLGLADFLGAPLAIPGIMPGTTIVAQT